MNVWTGIGYISNDPEVRYSTGPEPMAIARFPIGISRKTKGETVWDNIRCVAFGRTAETIEKYCTKGSQVGVTGHIQTGSYEDRDGKTVYTTDIIVDRIDFCGKREDRAPVKAKEEQVSGFTQLEEDVPF